MTAPAARAVADVLEARWGWRFDGPGLRRLDRALAEVAAASGTSLDAVAGAVSSDHEVRRAVLDRATVQETSWFRDGPVFRALATQVLPAIEHRPLRVWSAGCALGQEVWSVAVLCAERGIPCEIVGSDVSRPALARAEAGVYGDRELRGLSSDRRTRWLEPLADGRWRVRDQLRRGVRFASHDLIAEPPPLRPGTVDLVLCRYVLIYLSTDGVDRVLRRAADLLRGRAGRLVVGGAESLWHLTERFEVVPLDGAFAYRPRCQSYQSNRGQRQHQHDPSHEPSAQRGSTTGRPRPAAPAVQPPTPPEARSSRPERSGSAGVSSDTSSIVSSDTSSIVSSDTLLGEGEAAIARGDLEAAVKAFRGAAFLEPDSALAHLQLGLALEAAGDPGAVRAFRAASAALRRGGGPATVDGWRTEELLRLVGAKLGEDTTA